ncbi:hypothetical protein [Bifidobacterium leontopitheci]|uniref:hypothetical protein n=1 Tax=Bifidobacterium leontopitheci TaxID=2650774 RepID=UPI00126417DD
MSADACRQPGQASADDVARVGVVALQVGRRHLHGADVRAAHRGSGELLVGDSAVCEHRGRDGPVGGGRACGRVDGVAVDVERGDAGDQLAGVGLVGVDELDLLVERHGHAPVVVCGVMT